MSQKESNGDYAGEPRHRTTRPYRKGQRARQQADTRRRIVGAALALHAAVGPAKTTVTAIAAQAGVSRMTVYNHFPADVELYGACFEQWIALNPPPRMEGWRAIENADARLGVALAQLYDWYSRASPMIGNLLQDAPIVPALEEHLRKRWWPRVEKAIDILSSGRDSSATATQRLQAALRLALDFGAWKTLTGAGLSNREAAELAAGFVIVTDAGFVSA